MQETNADTKSISKLFFEQTKKLTLQTTKGGDANVKGQQYGLYCS